MVDGLGCFRKVEDIALLLLRIQNLGDVASGNTSKLARMSLPELNLDGTMEKLVLEDDAPKEVKVVETLPSASTAPKRLASSLGLLSLALARLIALRIDHAGEWVLEAQGN